MKHLIVRFVLKVLTAFIQTDRLTEELPARFQLFHELPPDKLLWDIGKAYRQVFSEPPWSEEWELNAVFDKLSRELQGDCFLVVMKGNREWPVGGFSWGRILDVEEIEEEIKNALGVLPKGLSGLLKKTGAKSILYFHEFAILKQFRGGVEGVRFLLRLGLEMGYRKGIRHTLFWSTIDSKIVPLSLYMGYQQIFQIEQGLPIIFLHNPGFEPLLKITQSFSPKKIVSVMRPVSRFLGKRRK